MTSMVSWSSRLVALQSRSGVEPRDPSELSVAAVLHPQQLVVDRLAFLVQWLEFSTSSGVTSDYGTVTRSIRVEGI